MDVVDDIIKRVKNLSVKQQNEILDILKGWQTGKQRSINVFPARLKLTFLLATGWFKPM